MKKTLTFLLILSSIIGFSQTKPTDPGFKSLITPRAVTFWWDAANSDPWMQSSYLGTAPNTWVKLWTATKTQVKLDSLANAKQDTLTLTTTGTGAATFDGHTLNIPTNSGVVSDATTTNKGIIQLAGDLSGTSASPTVVGLSLKAPLSLFDGLNSGYLPYWNGTKFVNSYLQYNGVNSLYIAGIYSATGGMIRLRDTYATGSNQTFMGIEFNSSPGFDWTIGKYSNNTEGLFQIRDQSSNIRFSIGENGSVTFPQLASTNPRLLSSSSTGQLTPIADGTNGQVLTTNGSGGYSFTTETDPNIYSWAKQPTKPSYDYAELTGTPTSNDGITNLTFTPGASSGIVASSTGTDATIPAATQTEAGLMTAADKVKIDASNTVTEQTLTGTAPTWNVVNGKDAIITLTGNTTITFINATTGNTGSLTVTNPATRYEITFSMSGRTTIVHPSVYKSSGKVYVSGSGKIDSYSYQVTSSYLKISGTLELQ